MTGLPSDLMRCCRWDAPRSMIRRVPLRASQRTRGTTPRQVSSARPPRRRQRSPRSSSMPLSPPGHDLGNASTKTEGGPCTQAAPLWPPAPCRAPQINHTTRRQRRCRSPCGSGRHLPAGAQPCYIRLDFRCRVTSCTSKTGQCSGRSRHHASPVGAKETPRQQRTFGGRDNRGTGAAVINWSGK